ncbi:MAG: mitochondrial fission ELM1 family protein [Candidatus Omnitrophica bacterium]|nr:mitochondrial fission ELM1 family protein [Candidatus Omnitrophota bacterium]MBU1924411.1 mitochondrial fission ELM1 family protein [Candidatus Omnitrophota bacterium]
MKINFLTEYVRYAPLVAIILLARVLPEAVLFAFARFLGKLGYYFISKRSHQAYVNICAAFGAKYSVKQRKAIVKEVFENLAVSFMELLLIPRRGKDWFGENVIFENKEYVEQAQKQGKGVIFVTAHLGNWELSLHAAAVREYKMFVMGRKQKPEFFNELIKKNRQVTGCISLEKGLPLREIIRGLRENSIFGLLADQSGRQGKELTLFGRNVFLAEGAFRIAQKTGAVLLPAFIRRERGKHVLTIEKPIMNNAGLADEVEMEEAMFRYRDLLENYISRYPGQWMWLHRRWKHTSSRRLMLLGDQKTGHLRQMQALAKLIKSKVVDYKEYILEVEFKNKLTENIAKFAAGVSLYRIIPAQAILKLVLNRPCYEQIEKQFADIVVCCGAKTRAVALILARENLAKAVAVMKPVPFSEDKFDVCIIPAHDNPKLYEHVYVSRGALNLVDFDYLSRNIRQLKKRVRLKEDGPKIGLLLGGSAKGYVMEKNYVAEVIAGIKKFVQENDGQVFISGSRRTPEAVNELLHLEFDGYNPAAICVFPKEENFDFIIGGILGVSDAVIISGESISMVSEAASSGVYPIVFRMKKLKKKTRQDAFLDVLTSEEMICLVDAEGVYEALVKFKKTGNTLRRLDEGKQLDLFLKHKLIGIS